MTQRELINLGGQLFVVWLVWRSYRKSASPPEDKYLTFWPRFWTGLVDSCVLWPLGFLMSLLLLLPLSPWIDVGFSVLSQLLGLTYTVWLHAQYGQTLGKMACKIRVVNHSTEGPISLQQAVLRECVPLVANLGFLGYSLYLIGSGAMSGEGRLHPEKVINFRVFWLFGAMPLLWFLVEVVTMFSNQKRRALHDLIAGTVVVRAQIVEVPQSTYA